MPKGRKHLLVQSKVVVLQIDNRCVFYVFKIQKIYILEYGRKRFGRQHQHCTAVIRTITLKGKNIKRSYYKEPILLQGIRGIVEFKIKLTALAEHKHHIPETQRLVRTCNAVHLQKLRVCYVIYKIHIVLILEQKYEIPKHKTKYNRENGKQCRCYGRMERIIAVQ